MEASVYNKLTSIDVSFNEYDDGSPTARNKLTNLIASIHNAPALDDITFSNVSIRIEDMKNLHRGAQKLITVSLYGIWIYDETSRVMDLIPAENITSFSMTTFSMKAIEEEKGEEEEQVADNALDVWISYVGNKYTGLRDLELCASPSYVPVQSKEFISASLVRTLSNLTQLENYAVDLVPPFQSVVNTLNATRIQLQHLMISIDAEDPVEETFNILASAHLLLNLYSTIL